MEPPTSSTPSYVLKYFDAKGIVEATRVMFAIANVHFEDLRYPINPQTYERKEYFEAVESGVFEMNLDRAPVLVVDGVLTLGQSKTIERFVAKRLGFFGSNEFESAQIDMICEHVRDIKQKYNDYKSGKFGEDLDRAKNEWIRNELPSFLTKLERCIPSQTLKYSVGDKISLSDVIVEQFIHEYFEDKASVAAAIHGCVKITAIAANVAEAARAWFLSRPKTIF